MSVKVGDEAPDFELRSHKGGTVKLSDFRGRRNVLVAFHPLAFTPVCATQMQRYQQDLPRFDAADTTVLGISVDAQPAKAAWARELGVGEPEQVAEAVGGKARDAEVHGFLRGLDGRIVALVRRSVAPFSDMESGCGRPANS